MASFSLAYPAVLKIEGGYVNDPNDPGGETKWGITKRDFPEEDIPNLTKERAIELYKMKYWDPLNLDQVDNQEIADKLLDMSVNLGEGTTALRLQRALNYLYPGRPISVDGDIGPQTLGAINSLPKLAARGPDLETLELALAAYHAARYIELVEGPDPRFDTFAKGWLRRAMKSIISQGGN
jgi:lysozyme family protein